MVGGEKNVYFLPFGWAKCHGSLSWRAVTDLWWAEIGVVRRVYLWICPPSCP